MTVERFPPLTLDEMTAEQRAAAEAILAGPRKRLAGPFNVWMRSPDLGDKLQRVGEYVRFRSSLPGRLNEFAILITARHWTAQFEWYAHLPLALAAGLDPQVAADLADGRRPADMQDDEAAIYDFCIELRRDRQVAEPTYAAIRDRFGERGVVDLIGLMGYYDTVSMTLNIGQVPLPDGQALPLRPLA